MFSDNDTIVAQATARGKGALAIVRLSGESVLVFCESMGQLASGKNFSDVGSHTIHLGSIVDKFGGPIDQVMFSIMHAPKTFTGQNTVEITCHNNPFIVESIIHRAISCGARMARPGEFSLRAVINNKIDLLQAESINELIHAQTQLGIEKSLSQVGGSLSAWVKKQEQVLLNALALCNASFEFIEEDMIEFDEEIRSSVKKVVQECAKIKLCHDHQRHIRQGVRIALIGLVNVGKSSIFNCIVGSQRAIVTDIPGTTRDVIESGFQKNGVYWTLVDTAGLRDSDNSVEQEGIKRSLCEVKCADVLVLVYDCSQKLSKQEQGNYAELLKNHQDKIVLVANKSDLASVDHDFSFKILNVSTTDDASIKLLELEVEKKINSLFKAANMPFLLNQRHYRVIAELEPALEKLHEQMKDAIAHEIVAHHIKECMSILADLTGRAATEKSMDAIFSKFCVGK